MMMTIMMIGDPSRPIPTVQIPNTFDVHPDIVNSPDTAFFSALHRYLASNQEDVVQEKDGDDGSDDFDVPVDAFSCDDFRMFDFKVKKCSRARSHDWTDCPFAHPGEKARRRDPRKYHYSGHPCPEFRKGGACKRGDACEYAHGVFECWLHPARYRTQPCKDATHCRRRVCFFAHTPDQLRLLPYTGTSPPSSPSTDSPPLSPSLSRLTDSIRELQIAKLKLGFGLGSPRARPAFMSSVSRSGLNPFDAWEMRCEEEPALERVESGKALRDGIYAKLSRENSLDRHGRPEPVPDFDWVSELVK